MHSLWNALNRISLIKQIIIGLIIGIAVAMAAPAVRNWRSWASSSSVL